MFIIHASDILMICYLDFKKMSRVFGNRKVTTEIGKHQKKLDFKQVERIQSCSSPMHQELPECDQGISKYTFQIIV